MIIINYKLVTKSTGIRERVKANKVGYRPSALVVLGRQERRKKKKKGQ